jgi:hypothetical protein
MISKKKLIELVFIFRGFANKYGTISFDTGIDWTNLSPSLKKLSPEDIYFTLAENSGNGYIFKNGYISSMLYHEKMRTNISLSYLEYPEPHLLQAKDVTAYHDAIDVPVSPQLEAFRSYLCAQTSKKASDVERFVFFFTLWVNSIPAKKSQLIVELIEQYFAIKQDEQFLSLFEAAREVQPSWLYAGLQKKDRIKNLWFDSFLTEGLLSLEQINQVHQFALAASSLYGFISYADA